MKINILPRSYFEGIKGSVTERLLLENYQIISIQSTCGFDAEPPFSEELLNSPHLLCLTFDDIANDPEPEDDQRGYFNSDHAEKIFRFVDDGSWPLLIHCTAGISRSGAVGEILDWYFNLFLERNDADHEYFVRQNRQIIPNHIVRKILLKVIENE